MLFHGKALEVFTAAYQNIQKIDEDEDLEVGLQCVWVVTYATVCDLNSPSYFNRGLPLPSSTPANIHLRPFHVFFFKRLSDSYMTVIK